MRRMRITVGLLMVLAVACGSASAQTRFGLERADWQFALRWLETNCLAPSAQPFLAELRARRVVMQRAFLAALDEGPTSDEVARVREGATARYRQGREMLQREDLRNALPPERLTALREMTEDRFVSNEVDSFVNGWRSNAMAGLAVVGDDVAVARLRAYAGGQSEVLAAAARAALAYRQATPQP